MAIVRCLKFSSRGVLEHVQVVKGVAGGGWIIVLTLARSFAALCIVAGRKGRGVLKKRCAGDAPATGDSFSVCVVRKMIMCSSVREAGCVRSGLSERMKSKIINYRATRSERALALSLISY